MKSSNINTTLEAMIYSYVKGELDHSQIEELWLQLLKHPHYLEHLKIEYLLKSTAERKNSSDSEDDDHGETGTNLTDWLHLAVVLITILVF